MMGKVILFYKYVDIANPKALVDWQKSFCESLKLTGRVWISQEGINGTLGGTIDSIEKYKQELEKHELFKDIDFKESFGNDTCFSKLKVTFKKEIVNLSISQELFNAKTGGVHITPEQAHNMIEQYKDDPNFLLVDTRNDYESRIGTFLNAEIPNTKNFRDFPEYINDNSEKFKDKKVLMFCTGGIRCERASSYVKKCTKAQEVYQIKGGIFRYVEKFPEGFFKGKLYVFDSRNSVKVTNDILGACDLCKKSYDDYSNCINVSCNRHIIVCPDCKAVYHNTCSQKCLNLVNENKVQVRTKFNTYSP